MTHTIYHVLSQMKEIALQLYTPLKNLYVYYIINTNYFLKGEEGDFVSRLLLYISYHGLLTVSLIYFLKVVASETVTTLDRFSQTSNKKKRYKNMDLLNTFYYKEIETQSKRFKRFCNICKTYKPPRTHHCRKCNKCYFKMDHHCALLDICIDFYNYKYFVLYLISGLIANMFCFITLFISLFVITYQVSSLVCLVFLGIDTLGFLVLLVYTLQNLLNNETTIERLAINSLLKGDVAYEFIFQEGSLFFSYHEREKINPYNLGWKKNIREVFGEKIIKGVTPTFTSLGDGINFPFNSYHVK
ncbi:Palmitoyltransferase ZDHHC20 [Cucumispora dikerogammari]|nr:Palmitoyltransferase ZDHHC20 [Cucumispora dikerogammari]